MGNRVFLYEPGRFDPRLTGDCGDRITVGVNQAADGDIRICTDLTPIPVVYLPGFFGLYFFSNSRAFCRSALLRVRLFQGSSSFSTLFFILKIV